MDRSSFKPDTRYTLALRDAAGKARPANLYVYRVYEKFMVARAAGSDGLVCKVAYDSVDRIVDEFPVAPQERFSLPAAVLDEKNWKDRAVMQHYASSPGKGK
jgi:hypothetical protein